MLRYWTYFNLFQSVGCFLYFTYVLFLILEDFNKPVVHNLFRRRATNRFLKPSGGQTSATTQPMSDKYMKTFTIMTCAVNHKVIEKWIHSTRPIYITVILTLFQ